MTAAEPGARADGAQPTAAAIHRPAMAALAGALGTGIEAKLLERALTHRSYAYEHGGLPHNERLEFLGDAVLGIVITDTLYRGFPDLPEGKLAKLRASIVNMRSLADVARSIDGGGLGQYLRLGRGEETTGGRDKASILADTLEALLGAVYLEHGLAGAEQVIHHLFDPLMSAVTHRGAALDWKTSLQELTAALALGAPDYVITSEGPDHDKSFTAAARVAGELFGTGAGRSKKEAEQSAAELAWTMLSERGEPAAERL
jgi:ribonuclease-3